MNLVVKHWDKLLLTAFSLIIVSNIMHPGFFPMHDDTQPTRVYQMAEALKDGQFPVRVVKDLGYGYTYPIFNFYAPLPYYVGAVFNLLGFSAITAAKLMFSIPVLIAPLSMYLLTKAAFNKNAALLASTIYLTFPYFAVNIFVRGAVGEYYAYSLLPFVFLGLITLHSKIQSQKKNTFYHILLTSIALSAVVISHNLTAFMASMLLIVAAVTLLLFNKNKKKFIVSLLAITILTFLLSAFYILPAILEMKFTNVESQIGATANFQDHFVCINQFWNSQWGYGGSTPTCLDGFSYKLGKSNIILALFGIAIGLFYIVKRKIEKSAEFTFITVLTVISAFLTLKWSNFIWETIPKMEFLQYPWRFINFISLCISLSSGMFIYFVQKVLHKRSTMILTIIVVIVTAYLNIKLFTPQFHENKNVDYYTNTKTVRFKISKISDEYLPRNFDKPQSENDIPQKPFQITSGQGEVKNVSDNSNNKAAVITLRQDSTLKANVAYFPSWKLFSNGKEIDFRTTSKGLEFPLSKGTHDIKLKFTNTPIQNTANILTLIGGILAIVGIIFYRQKSKK